MYWEEFGNGGFTLKMRQMFSVDIMPGKFDYTGTRSRKMIIFLKKLRLKMFFIHNQLQAGVFKFLRFKERFRKAPN